MGIGVYGLPAVVESDIRRAGGEGRFVPVAATCTDPPDEGSVRVAEADFEAVREILIERGVV
ncbi:hypothetical protein FHR38_004949 [Micromonospora polyrhachis]|uniref:Uncharacterized protein n=1 Tax=Micromonospora polyrhachis TaxID=1282883 RepID=A0A7W7WRE3_9ACTN|nr:hypothetical protein [Micromonospora polyrhachis]MBB4961216.1 hypothetical protein [Micromonospora polyrhachis]